MAFTLYASVGGETTQLNDSNPFRLESAEELTGADIVRHQQRGPLQQGATDLGFRLQPRVLTLNLLFYAATDAILDTHRDTLMDTFKPLTDISIFLYAVRDDGTTLRLTCKTVDDIDIELVREDRPGHLHRASVKLRAANPLWLDQTVNSTTFTGAALNWWTAGGVIGAGNVMEHTEYPTQGQAWTYTSNLTGGWTIAIRSAQETGAGTATAFQVGTAVIGAIDSTNPRLYWGTADGGGNLGFRIDSQSDYETTLSAGTANYMLVHDIDHLGIGLFQETLYSNAGDAYIVAQINNDFNINHASRRWRSNGAGAASTYWASELPKVAVYNKTLTSTERTALNAWMAGSAILGTVTVVNSGDTYAYPLITIRGPVESPMLTNVNTGAVLDLAGLVVDSTDTITVDLRNGDKLVYNQNGVNLLGSVNTPVTLAAWSLAPAPIATGGTNTILVQGGGLTVSDTRYTIEHYDHYLGI